MCKRDAPRAAFDPRHIQVRGPGQQSSAENAKLRAQIDRLNKDNAQKDVDLAKQHDELEAATAKGGMEVDEGDGREDVREALGKQRAAVSDLEKVYKTCPSPPLAAALTDARASFTALQVKLVEGRSLEENLRVVGLNVGRREKAVARIKEDGLLLQDKIEYSRD